MTDDIKDESARDEADFSFLPGQRLKKAREVRGLTLEQVAQELNLSVRFLNFMEADSYKDLPEPAFVRGYMRRYAQLVKLSPDDIAGKFDQCYAADTATPAVDERPRNPIQLLGIVAKPRLKLGRLLRWASVALIVALLIGFLWSGFHAGQAVTPATVQEPTATAPLVAAPAVEAGVPVATTDAVLPQPAATSNMTQLPTPSSAVSVAASPAASVPAAAAPVVPAPVAVATGPDSVVLALGAASWISVQDAKRQTVFSGLRQAGQLSLKGEAPFYVNIGNASVVTLVFNGKAVDLKPYTQGAVATLTLKR